MVDEDGAIVRLNRRAESLFGYRRGQLIGEPVSRIIPVGLVERLSAEGSQPGDDACEPPIGSGLELVARREDGSSFPIEITLCPLDGAAGILVSAAIRDISVRRAADQQQARLASAVDQTADAISMHDLDGTVTYVNRAYTKAYGYEAAEIVGRYGGMIDSGQHPPSFFVAIRAAAAAGQTWTGTIVNRRKDGGLIELEAVISAIRDPDGQVASYVQVERDVTAERTRERAALSDAHERRTIESALAQIDPAASVMETAAAACAVIHDLPGVESTFAAVLDEAGGTVLAATGRLRPAFTPGRAMPYSRVAYFLDRARDGAWIDDWRPRAMDGAWSDAVSSTGLYAMAYAPLRGARGIVGIVGIGSHDPSTAAALVDHMPALATFASILGAQLAPKLDDRRRIAEDRALIQGALDVGAFWPVFQPIVDLEHDQVVGHEALTRFADGVRPDARFASANRVGLGLDLEVATVRAALAAADCLPPGTYLSLNASPALIRSGTLKTLIAGFVRPIVLEITEHEAIDDYPALRAALADFGPNVRLAVDDAGAGYASFRHILELAPDLVKLDLGLIRGIDGDPARQALIAGMAFFAQQRSIGLIAEGIETKAELETLRTLAIPFGQGYLLGRPSDGRAAGPRPAHVGPDRSAGPA